MFAQSCATSPLSLAFQGFRRFTQRSLYMEMVPEYEDQEYRGCRGCFRKANCLSMRNTVNHFADRLPQFLSIQQLLYWSYLHFSCMPVVPINASRRAHQDHNMLSLAPDQSFPFLHKTWSFTNIQERHINEHGKAQIPSSTELLPKWSPPITDLPAPCPQSLTPN